MVTIDPDVNWGDTGVALFYTVYNAVPAVVIARTSTGVAEHPAGSGVYHRTGGISVDEAVRQRIVWDDGTDYASESLDGYIAGALATGAVSIAAGGITSSSFAAGAINAAAVATDALGALELGADAVTEISAAIEAGGINLTITPIQATVTNPRYSTRDLPPIAQDSEPTEVFIITDAAGSAVNLSGKSLRLVVVTVDDDADTEAVFDDTITSSFKYETGGGGITIGGAGNNQVTVVHDDAKTGTPGEFRYFLWNTTDKLLLVKGSLKIEPALIDVT